MTIEELIKERKKLGISAKTVARISGYSAIWIYQVEEGRAKASKKLCEKYKKVLDLFKNVLTY